MSGVDTLVQGIIDVLPKPGDPCNLDGVYYQGRNVAALQASALEHGYDLPQWGTYRQALAHGLQVRKGEHGTPIAYIKHDDDGTVYRTYKVFNVAQCDPIEGGAQ